jgi:CubicO group peptidase (beta-lactamase class C family)/D-alanyl-D-alanine dipeptidase
VRKQTAQLWKLTSFLLLAAPAWAANVSPEKPYQAAAAELRRFIAREMQDKELPAVSIVLVDGQRVVWAEGFGLADPVKKVQATADTVYRIGSVSKLFTDIAIMQQVEKSAIDLDAPVTKYLPEFHPKNPFGKPITLRELMSHRSGLIREPPVGHYFAPEEPTLADTIASLNATELVYPPQERTKYSNAAIATVGYVLEKKFGRPFPDYLKDAVLKPLDMRNSSFAPEPTITANLAKAYMWTYDGRKFEAPTFQLGLGPAGCMYSTVLDLGKFMSMLFAGGVGERGRVLEKQTLEEMWKPQFAQAKEGRHFGIGFALGELEGHRLVGHGGAIYGFATEMRALPDQKLGVVAVTTMDSANAEMSKIADAALRMMLAAKAGKALPEPPETEAIPAEMAKRLAGRYGTGDEAIDLIEQNGLLSELPVQGGYQVTLRKRGDDLLVDDRLANGVTMRPTSDGIEVNHKLLKRAAIVKPAPIREEWQGLIGEYGWDHDTLYVLERDGKLTTLIEWYEFEPLEQVSRDVFRYPKRGLYDNETVTFTRDDHGKATAVKVGEVIFKRRPVGPDEGNVFRIQPRKSIDELRKEALAQQPPKEDGKFRTPELVELNVIDPSIKLDIRYATTNDFLSTPVYLQAKAYMQKPAAEAVARASQELHKLGYGLLIHDSYRPWYVTKIFWEATPDDKRIFVANPAEGSRHNRGCAVDLTLYDLKTGEPLKMVGVYDEMSNRSYPFYPGGTGLERWQRDLLRHEMEKQGFQVYDFEWWHFDYKDWREYPILNLTFEQLAGAK